MYMSLNNFQSTLESETYRKWSQIQNGSWYVFCEYLVQKIKLVINVIVRNNVIRNVDLTYKADIDSLETEI